LIFDGKTVDLLDNFDAIEISFMGSYIVEILKKISW
jgi:hypothetical protein